MNYLNAQEQEHWDHVAGSASEFQNCFEEAGVAARRLHDEYYQAIAAVVSAGRFAVVNRCPYHCKATDAAAGSVEYLRSDCATREDAVAAMNALYAAEGLDCDEELYVLPREAMTAAPVSMSAEEEVPF